MSDERSLGLESGTVRVVPYDPAWPALYEREARRILGVVRSRGLSLVLEHTGSTSVPGLAAKPILDILGGHTGTDLDATIAAIVAAGYTYRGEQEIPGRHYFRRGTPRSHHLHLTAIDSTFWRDHRAFRDYLRRHAAVRDAYAELKARLAARYPRDRESYIDGKTEFVHEVLARAAADRG